jgi:TolB protein
MYGRLDGWNPVEFNAKPFSSLEQHSFCEEGGDYDPDISADGKLIVFSSLRHAPNPDIYVKQIAGATATRLTSDPASEIQPCFSPDGTRVAYASNRAGNWDIWVTQVDGSNSVRMTTSVSNDIHPSWSPDGKYLVYCSYGTRSRQWELWVINAGNPSAKKWIGYGMFPEWNPNPKINKIAFQLARYRGSQWFSVWTIDMVDGEAKFPTEIITNLNYACICPSWSFDGGNLVYSTVNRSSYEKDTEPAVPNTSGEDIWIVNLDGQNNHRLTSSDTSDFSPTWSPDNRVFFCSNRKYIDNIWSAKPSEVDFTHRQQPVQMSSSHPQSGGIRAN